MKSLLTLTPTTQISLGVCLGAYRSMMIKPQRPYIIHSTVQTLCKAAVPFLLVHNGHWLIFFVSLSSFPFLEIFILLLFRLLAGSIMWSSCSRMAITTIISTNGHVTHTGPIWIPLTEKEERMHPLPCISQLLVKVGLELLLGIFPAAWREPIWGWSQQREKLRLEIVKDRIWVLGWCWNFHCSCQSIYF